MTLFAIRDDDTSGWTQPEQLEATYRTIWDRGIPVSLSVIPESVQSFFPGDPERFYQTSDKKPIHTNQALVDYLRPLIHGKTVGIMLHGFDHVYVVSKTASERGKPATEEWMQILRKGAAGADLVWRGECIWKDAERLSAEIVTGKSYLETVFGGEVSVFVPPSNQIGRDAVRALRRAKLNLSGTLGPGLDRPLSPAYLRAYTKRWMFKLARGRTFPRTLDLGGHKELVAYSLTSITRFDELAETLRFCYSHRAPFVVAVHYWELADEGLRDHLVRLCDLALNTGFEPATVAACFDG